MLLQVLSLTLDQINALDPTQKASIMALVRLHCISIIHYLLTSSTDTISESEIKLLTPSVSSANNSLELELRLCKTQSQDRLEDCIG